MKKRVLVNVKRNQNKIIYFFLITLNIILLLSPVTFGIQQQSNIAVASVTSAKNFIFVNSPYQDGLEKSEYIEKQNNNFPYVNYNENKAYLNLNSIWPMCCHDTRHTGLSPYNTSDNPLIVKWRVQTAYGVDGGIAIDDNGIIYFGSNDRYMNAVYPDGTWKWRYQVGDWIESTPAIANDGTIYAGCWDGYLYAFNPNGSLKWCHNCDAVISYASPLIAPDGTIYTATMEPGYSLIAVNQNGVEKWRYQTGASITSAPVLGLDGTIFFGSTDTYIYAVNPNGTLRWRYPTGDQVMGSASIADDGTVYIASWDGYLYALNPGSGSLVWKCHIAHGSKANPAIGLDETIYIGEGTLFAINPNGTVKWTFIPGSGNNIEWSSTAISADGIIYFGTNIGDDAGGDIIAVNPDGTKHWQQQISDRHVDSSPAIGSDGTVYIGCANFGPGYLYAFGRGPLNAHAHGPYTGYYQVPIQFTGEAFGGTPPYTYHWDFGDGQTSNEQNPVHTYTATGLYDATLTAMDSEGNHSTDNASVTITYALPSVEIVKPMNYLYILGFKLLKINECTIFGPITVKVQASQNPFGIDRVEIILDGKLVATDYSAPYQWLWVKPSFQEHLLRVTAYDTRGNSSTTVRSMFKYF